MFKVIALVGAIAGGTTYGLYAHTDLFDKKCNKCDGSCPLAVQKPCCGGDAVKSPPCCANPCPKCADGCEFCELCATDCAKCCGTASAGAASPKPACCAAKTAAVSAKKPTCCATPCPGCADGCDGCPLCAIDCGACC